MPARKNLPDEEIIRALQGVYGIVSIAARHLGVSTRTLQRRISANHKLTETAEDAFALLYETLFMRVVQAGIDGHLPSIIWFLNRFAIDRGYGTRRTIAQALKRQREEDLLAEHDAFIAKLKATREGRDFLEGFTVKTVSGA